MTPLADMDREALRGARGVVFDVDDTVTRGGRLELLAFEAMWALRRAGLCLIAVTGRPLGWTDAIALQWPVIAAVGENGAGWAFKDSAGLCTGYAHTDKERAAQEEIRARVNASVAEHMPHVRKASDQQARRCDLAFDVAERAALPSEEIAQLMQLIEEAGAHASVSSVHAHATAGAWDKATGIVRAAAEATGDDLDRDRDRWLFIGDSGNDAAAFEWFPQSVGVANVADHIRRLPTPPRFVTTGDRGEGFAELATLLLGARP